MGGGNSKPAPPRKSQWQIDQENREARLRAERREAQIKADEDDAIALAERGRLQEEATARAQLNA